MRCEWVKKNIDNDAFQNLIWTWSILGTIRVSFRGGVYKWVCSALFALKVGSTLIWGYFKSKVNGWHIPYHYIQWTLQVYMSYG